MKKLIGIAALVACIALPGSLKAQATWSVCKNGTTTKTTGSAACSTRGGVNKDATEDMREKYEADSKAESDTKTAVNNSEKAVSTAAENTGKAVKKAGSQTGEAVSNAAEATGKAAKNTGKAVAKGAKDAAAAVTDADKTNTDAVGAVAKCKDDSYSHNADHGDVCKGHDGVATWMDGTQPE